MIREWIIFALCLGIGGHLALGVMLHAPDMWPWSTAGFYGLMSGVGVYALVQTARGIWKMLRMLKTRDETPSSGGSW